jgi:hypothetical protein
VPPDEGDFADLEASKLSNRAQDECCNTSRDSQTGSFDGRDNPQE